MTHNNLTISPVLPRSSPLSAAVRHALSPRIAGGLLAVSLTGLASPVLALELADLNGRNGFIMNGINALDFSGLAVSDAGDINGDGIADVLIGARDHGYVVFGTQTGFPAALELADLNGRNGLRLNTGVVPWPVSVSGAGDINGDGIDDLIIGSRIYPFDDSPDTYSVQSYVVFGTREEFPAVLTLSDLNGDNGFILNGTLVYEYPQVAVSGAGDVNGDGIDDLIIGDYRASANRYERDEAGQSYVVFGTREGFPAVLELADLDGDNGFTINGINAFDRSGRSVSGAGDVNGDGIDDLIIGALGASPTGQSYVIFGTRAGFPAALELSALDGSNGFTLNAIEEDDYSGSVSGAGDVNGDGIDDLIIGEPQVFEAHVVFGTQAGFPAALELSALNGSNGFTFKGAGHTVSGAGDVNGDRIDDLIIGAPRASPPGGRNFAGQSYVVLGTQDDFPAVLTIADLDGTQGFAINGINAGDGSGASVSNAGDVNGDRIDDLIISAPGADPHGKDRAGQSYVVFGKRTSLPAPLSTVGLYDPAASRFYLRNSHAGGPADTTFRFGPGGLGWLPLSGDWSGEGTATIGLYDPVAGQFYLRNSLAGGSADLIFRFGPREADWLPLSGDWDGDGQATVGLYNPVSGTFFLKNSPVPGPADLHFRFGPSGFGWQPLSGDWDGDGITTVGLYDPVTSRFYLNNRHAGGAADLHFRFGPGNQGQVPLAGDWDGDRVTTVGLYDPATSRFYLRNNHAGGGADLSFRFGRGGLGWLPVTGQWTGP